MARLIDSRSRSMSQAVNQSLASIPLEAQIHGLLNSVLDFVCGPRVVCCPINREVVHPEQNAYVENLSKCRSRISGLGT